MIDNFDTVFLNATLKVLYRCIFPNFAGALALTWQREGRRTVTHEYLPEIVVTAEGSAISNNYGVILSFSRQYYFNIDGPSYSGGTENLVIKGVLPGIWHRGVKGEDVYSVNSADLVRTMTVDTETDNTASFSGYSTVSEIETVRDTIRPIADAWAGEAEFRCAAHQLPFDTNRWKISGQYLNRNF